MKKMKPNTTMVRRILPEGGSGPWFAVDTRTGAIRKRWWTKARIPGTTRSSRMPGGSGFRGLKQWESNRP